MFLAVIFILLPFLSQTNLTNLFCIYILQILCFMFSIWLTYIKIKIYQVYVRFQYTRKEKWLLHQHNKNEYRLLYPADIRINLK